MRIYKKFIKLFIVGIYFMANDGCANQNIFNITPEQQLQVKASPFNFVMKDSSSKKLRVYLYAEDEQSEKRRYFSCSDGVVDERQTVVKKGHYYLYLYDLQAKKFLPTRTRVFSDFHNVTMNVEGG
ncbi:MAG: hypothetical protein P4L79_13325 [Legionella sp.]|uniref:hypothetical protein n=1 Tax=Legionella sp. TaxID=459 RepID=UPI00284FCDD2|nr:hypothetical protein [Legionella sp.]